MGSVTVNNYGIKISGGKVENQFSQYIYKKAGTKPAFLYIY